MDKLIDSPQEAYESSLPLKARHTLQLGDPVAGQTPEQATLFAESVCRQAMAGDLGEELQGVVMAEADLYGMELTSETIPEFLEARRAKIKECDRMFAESFKQRAPVLAGHLAEDVANPGEDPNEIRALLDARLEQVWTGVQDPLLEFEVFGKEVFPGTGLAGFDTANRGVLLNYGDLVVRTMSRDHPLQWGRELFDMLAEHESMHAMAGVWYDETADWQEDRIISSGLATREHGTWLDEGNIEKYREGTFGEGNFVYEVPVLALAAADAVDPGFAHARLRAAVLNEGHGDMIGRLEVLFGPGAPESLDPLVYRASEGKIDMQEYKNRLIQLLPHKGMRAVAGRAFDKTKQKLESRPDLQALRID